MTLQSRFEPRDPRWEARVTASFARQSFMATLGARLARLAPGEVEIVAADAPGLKQQHGFFHAGVTTTLADSAAGYAALSLYPAGFGVLTTEFKMNLLNPARGARLRAQGRVLKPGRTLTICAADVFGESVEEGGPDAGSGSGSGARPEGARGASGGPTIHVATGLFTMIALEGVDD